MADRIILGGAPEGFDARLLLRELERGHTVLHVARDDKRAEAMRAALAVWAPDVAAVKRASSVLRTVRRIGRTPG